MKSPNFDRPGLLADIQKQFALDWHGIHGFRHWSRALHHRLAVGALRGGNELLIELLAYLHDSRSSD